MSKSKGGNKNKSNGGRTSKRKGGSKSKSNGDRNRESNGGRQRQGQNTGQEQSKQGKRVRFGEEEKLEETRAENADEQEVTGRLAKVRTGRGKAGLIRGGDERYWADETSRKGQGKGNVGKCEHEGKGGGEQQRNEEKEEILR